MASIIMVGVTAVINAVAFSGGNYMFSLLNKSGAQQEAKRHDAAVEELNRATVEYNIKRAKNQDWLSTEISRKKEADEDLYSVNSDFDEYKRLYGEEPKLPHPNLQKPVLNYTPSNDQQKYELAFVGVGTATATAVLLKLVY